MERENKPCHAAKYEYRHNSSDKHWHLNRCSMHFKLSHLQTVSLDYLIMSYRRLSSREPLQNVYV